MLQSVGDLAGKCACQLSAQQVGLRGHHCCTPSPLPIARDIPCLIQRRLLSLLLLVRGCCSLTPSCSYAAAGCHQRQTGCREPAAHQQAPKTLHAQQQQLAGPAPQHQPAGHHSTPAHCWPQSSILGSTKCTVSAPPGLPPGTCCEW